MAICDGCGVRFNSFLGVSSSGLCNDCYREARDPAGPPAVIFRDRERVCLNPRCRQVVSGARPCNQCGAPTAGARLFRPVATNYVILCTLSIVACAVCLVLVRDQVIRLVCVALFGLLSLFAALGTWCVGRSDCVLFAPAELWLIPWSKDHPVRRIPSDVATGIAREVSNQRTDPVELYLVGEPPIRLDTGYYRGCADLVSRLAGFPSATPHAESAGDDLAGPAALPAAEAGPAQHALGQLRTCANPRCRAPVGGEPVCTACGLPVLDVKLIGPSPWGYLAMAVVFAAFAGCFAWELAAHPWDSDEFGWRCLEWFFGVCSLWFVWKALKPVNRTRLLLTQECLFVIPAVSSRPIRRIDRQQVQGIQSVEITNSGSTVTISVHQEPPVVLDGLVYVSADSCLKDWVMGLWPPRGRA